MEPSKEKSYQNVVVISDNFPFRQTIKALLNAIEQDPDNGLKIFSSDNGAEGLGFVYITSPLLVIVDTTLPKYSNKEILDFFVNNSRFKAKNLTVIVLDNKSSISNLPENFIALNKNNKNTPTNLLTIFREKLNSGSKIPASDFSSKLINKVFHSSVNRTSFFSLNSILSLVLLSILIILGKIPKDANLVQERYDQKIYRTKYYPALVAIITTFAFLSISLVVFSLSQFGLYKHRQELTAALTTMTVDSTLDDSDFDPGDGVCDTTGSSGTGPCTLRAAIQEANALAGTDNIHFDIPGAGVHTIIAASDFPTITETLIIDGSTQTGSDCTSKDLMIELENVTLSFQADVSGGTVKGLIFNGDSPGFNYYYIAHADIIKCNIIGIDEDGVTLSGKNTGIISGDDSYIGGTAVEDRNIISGNTININVVGTNVTVAGNFIGTFVDGLDGPESLQEKGILLNTSSNVLIDNNVVGYFSSGIHVQPVEDANYNNIAITNNLIGLQADGESAAGNYVGINIIFGEEGFPHFGSFTNFQIAGNTISANIIGISSNFVQTSDTKPVTIKSNRIGLAKEADIDLGNSQFGIYLNTGHNIIGGTNPEDGNTFGYDGVGLMSTTGSTEVLNNTFQNMPSAVAFNAVSPIINITVSDNYFENTQETITFINVAGGIISNNVICNNTLGYSYLQSSGGVRVQNNIFANESSTSFIVMGASSGNPFMSNQFIDNNDQVHIDLGNDGPTLNDAGDTDFGPNQLLNYPTEISLEDGNIQFKLDTAAGDYLIELHVLDTENSCSNVSSLVCSEVITHPGGNVEHELSCPGLPAGESEIRGLAVEKPFVDSYLNTSELSPAYTIYNDQPIPTDTPEPTPTDTPEPTPTDTPEPTPTDTPEPTPTDTPEPTLTPTPALPSPPSSLGPEDRVDGGFTNNITPLLSFTLSAPDEELDLAYRIQVLLDAEVVVDYTSSEDIQGQRSFTVGQAAGDGTYNDEKGEAGQVLEAGEYYWRVMAIGDSGESSWTEANEGEVAFTVDLTSPNEGFIDYTDGYLTVASVPLTVADGTDPAGIATDSRTIERSAAELSDNTCAEFDSFIEITTSGGYPDYTDNTVSPASCYQYRYLVEDTAGNQTIYTTGNIVKITVGAPTAPGVPETESPTTETEQVWIWEAAVDVVSGISHYIWKVYDEFDNLIDEGITATLEVTTNLGTGIYNFIVQAMNNAGLLSDEAVGNLIVEATPTNTPIPTNTPEPTPTDTPEPTATNTPTPTNTPVPTATNTPLPTATYTPAPTATNTPTPTNTSLPTPTNTTVPIPTNEGSGSSVVPTIQISPTEELVPSEELPVTPTESFSTDDAIPTSLEIMPTEEQSNTATPTITPSPFVPKYEPEEDSLLNAPAVKSVVSAMTKTINNTKASSSMAGSVIDGIAGVATSVQPILDNFNYLISLQFIGTDIARRGVSAINLVVLAVPAITAAFTQPKLFYYALTWFWKRKNKLSWGVVLDKRTHAPVAFARITLLKEGKVVDSQTVDLQGKYGFIADKGNYDLIISHPDYDDLRTSVSVHYDGEIIASDFELSPLNRDTLSSSLKWHFYSLKKIVKGNLFVVNTIVFSTGFVYTLFAITNSLSVFNYAVFTLYLLQIVLISIFYLTREKKWGQVIDISTSLPVPGAVIRLFDNEKQLDVTITDHQGRYSFVLKPGEYYIKVNVPGFIFPSSNSKNTVTNKTGEKLIKFSLEETNRIGMTLYVERFANVGMNREAILSPFN